MRKPILILITLLFSCLILKAQQSNREVTATAGETSTTNNIQIDWTIGEPLISSLESESTLLTQGFHQPTLIINNDEDLPSLIDAFKMFPNPTSDQLTIDLLFKEQQEIELSLFNLKGQKLLTNKYTGIHISDTLNLTAYPSGLYNISFLLDGVKYVYPITLQKAN